MADAQEENKHHEHRESIPLAVAKYWARERPDKTTMKSLILAQDER